MTTNSGKGQHTLRARKKWRENTGVHNWRENRKKGFLSKGDKGFSFRHLLRVSLPGYDSFLYFMIVHPPQEQSSVSLRAGPHCVMPVHSLFSVAVGSGLSPLFPVKSTKV